MRWPPASLSRFVKSLPSTSILIQVLEGLSIEYFQDILSIKLVYADARSCANNFASCPPSAPLISITRFIVLLLFVLFVNLEEGRRVERLPFRTPRGSNPVADHLAVPSIIR